MSYQDAFIPTEGSISLHAWIFRPPTGDGPFPAVTMAHGFGGVKYRGMQGCAERFSPAGFVVLVHDHRGFGLSGGEPRGDIDPWQQIADWRRPISFLESLDDVDADRLGIWGSSYAWGHRPGGHRSTHPGGSRAGADDQRLRAGPTARARRPRAGAGGVVQRRRTRSTGGQATRISAPQQPRSERPGCLPTIPGAWRSPTLISRSRRRSKNRSTSRCGPRKAQMYEPGAWVTRVSPTPLLMVAGRTDTVTPSDLALAAYERALEPKRLAIFPGDHFDSYVTAFEPTSEAATEWFCEHLSQPA
ncbi:alpha/beta hydrolase [Streptomyces sp. NPDC002573]|uniref:alpha/beta hydrolase n=1 Tax=Streptomyces sp. NPDC002573 TaxID=3364651 RepID=UPI0036AA7F54